MARWPVPGRIRRSRSTLRRSAESGDRAVHSGATAAVEPLALLGDIGIALLGIAALKAGAPRWAAAAIAVGAPGEGTGFAVRTLRTATRSHPAAEPAPATAIS